MEKANFSYFNSTGAYPGGFGALATGSLKGHKKKRIKRKGKEERKEKKGKKGGTKKEKRWKDKSI